MSKTYQFYFAFGSNLKKERQRCKNSTFHCIGELKDHRLAFRAVQGSLSIWNGAVATVVPSPGDSVWGAVWKVTQEDVEALNIQENVAGGTYKPVGVDIHTADGAVLQDCLTYVRQPINDEEGLPSKAYISVITIGAKEVGLPQEYLDKLESTEHNGNRARLEELNRIAQV